MTNREKIDLCILSLLDHRHSTVAEIREAVHREPVSGDFPHDVDLVLKWLCEDGLCYEIGPRHAAVYALTPNGQDRLRALMAAVAREASEDLSRRTWEYEHRGVSYPGPIIAAHEQPNAAPLTAADELGGCTLPPAGWECTRQAGHEGPCAAVPIAPLPSADCDDEEDTDAHVMFCVTDRAVDAWWASLPIQTRADVMITYYETLSMADEPAPELTEAGRRAAGSEACA